MYSENRSVFKFFLSATTVSRLDRLSVFTFLMAVVRLFHLLSFPEWIHYDKWSYLLMLFVLLALARPQSVYLLMLMLASSMLRTLSWMPFTPNHIFFEFWVDAAVLFSLVYNIRITYPRKGDIYEPHIREKLFESFAPTARISIMVLYFFAVFHKLNWDYLNPEISCGTFLTRGLLERLHIGYLPYWGKLVAVWGTLIIELVIPILFLFRATRRWGILLGLVFHFVLAIHPHSGLYSFSSLLIGFFYLFTPPDFNAFLQVQFTNWREKLRQRSYQVYMFVLVAGIALAWVYTFWQGGFEEAAHIVWYAWWGFVFLIYVRFMARPQAKERSFTETFCVRPRVLWLFSGIIFLNGLSPYLGLKTQTSYSMFSNLRTEGRVINHLFMPRCLVTTRWQDDLITVLHTNLPDLEEFADGKRMLTYFELRRYASGAKRDFFVDYRRGDQTYHAEVTNGISTDPQLILPYSWPVKKLLRFRPVYADTCRCQH